ncbi:hypothetical protein QCA50_000465 [Cerrena zonata]|uniref:Uncharacterized protein n=1 Tax=Cerrena zonata TaxID=2478898 RepID=A0AAW0GT34_9APHY
MELYSSSLSPSNISPETSLSHHTAFLCVTSAMMNSLSQSQPTHTTNHNQPINDAAILAILRGAALAGTECGRKSLGSEASQSLPVFLSLPGEKRLLLRYMMELHAWASYVIIIRLLSYLSLARHCFLFCFPSLPFSHPSLYTRFRYLI